MSRFSHRIAFVVPTLNRPALLRKLLRSLEEQSVTPDQLVLVDASDEPVDALPAEFPSLRIDYRRVRPPSLSKQRNVGMAALDPSITLAGYLDDDLTLEPGALEAMLAFWESAPAELGGTNFNIINATGFRIIWPERFFLIESRRRGIMLRSGFQSTLWPALEAREVDWLCGGATVWRREVINQFDYDEWYIGTGYLEDVDYSYRVKQRYRLMIVPGARVDHVSPPMMVERNYLYGIWEIINRLHFVGKHPELSRALCWWALTGRFLLNLSLGLRRADRGYLLRAHGNLAGFGRAFSGRFETLPGTVK